MNQSQRPAPEEVIAKRIRSLALCRRLERALAFLGVAILALGIVFRCVLGVLVVEGDDMKPFLIAGDIALYERMAGNWEIGDAVVLEKDGQLRIGRIAAMQGDAVDMRNGSLWIDGARVIEKDIYEDTEEKGILVFPLVVGNGEYLVLADHRSDCVDGRDYGLVEKDCFRGKVLAVFRKY